MSDQPRLEEKAISEFVKSLLSNQLDSVKKIGVDIQTNLIKLIQGNLDSVEVSGQGIATEDIHIKEVQVQTDEISIDPLSALLGRIRLNEPIDTTIRMVLTESDLNHTMNSDLVVENLIPINLNVNGAVVPIELKPPFRLRLLRGGKIRFTGILKIHEVQGVRESAFTSVVCPRTETRPILLETFCCAPDQGSSIPFLIALMSKMESLISQPFFDIGGTILRVASFAVEGKNLIVEIETQTQELPSL